MGCISFLSAFVLVCLCRIQGSSAVSPVFVQTGKDLLLNVMEAVTLEEDDVVLWKFNVNENVVRLFLDKEPRVSLGYTGRIEFPAKNYSVTLKILTKADSGVYAAQKIGEKTETLAEYNVTVQDPVSPAKLTVVSRSSDSCNVTVTCSTQDSHINSIITCDNQTCSQEGGEQSQVTTSGASLHVYVTNNSIICNHSNQVSWTRDMKMAEHLCPQQEGSVQPHTSTVVSVVVPLIVILILSILLIAFILYLRKRRNSKTENIENTVYETPQQTDAVQSLHLTPTNDDSVTSPTSTYALVGPHTGGKTLPESLYASVEKPAKS